VIPIPKARGRASIWKAKLKNKKNWGGTKLKKKKKKLDSPISIFIAHAF